MMSNFARRRASRKRKGPELKKAPVDYWRLVAEDGDKRIEVYFPEDEAIKYGELLAKAGHEVTLSFSHTEN